jgi:hypothetical protein
MNMSEWFIIKDDGLPQEGVTVLVSGGVAQYRYGQWYTGMEEPLFQRPIQWEVTKWMPIPQ